MEESIDLLSLLGRRLDEPAVMSVFKRFGAMVVNTRLTYSSVQFPEVGLEFQTDESLIEINTIFIRTAPSSNHRQVYPDALPGGIKQGMSRSDVAGVLGEPHRTGRPLACIDDPTESIVQDPADEVIMTAILTVFAEEGPTIWDLWHFNRHSIHAEYDLKQETLLMLTLLRTTDIPDVN